MTRTPRAAQPPGYQLLAITTLVMLASACVRSEPPASPPPAAPAPTPTASASAAPAPTHTSAPAPTPDLSPRPLAWFAPLPPMPTHPGRMFTGSDDFLDLFKPDVPWSAAQSYLHVFKLYGEWVAYHASDAELRTAVEAIRRMGLALAVEAGPLDPPPECGQGIEGFAGTDEGRLIANRILNAGGRIDLIALDEPLFFASIYDGENACRWDAEKVAAEVGEYVSVMRGYFPEIAIGDTEPLAGASTPRSYTAWLETFRQVNGYDLAFLHMDIDWGRTTWPGDVKQIEDFGRSFGVPVGIIYNGNFNDPSDEAWLSIAGERVLRYEDQTGGRPEHILFQSWHDKPDRVLPESEPYTFTGFIRTYFEDRASLGLRREGAGANLAYQKTARVSSAIGDQVGAYAVDGDVATAWNSGGFPLQWIQVDLGRSYDIAEIRLTVEQTPPGQTIHVVYGQGEGTGGAFDQLHIFSGTTASFDVLIFAPPEPLRGIRTVRIETTTTPSWVGWREIEVVAAQ